MLNNTICGIVLFFFGMKVFSQEKKVELNEVKVAHVKKAITVKDGNFKVDVAHSIYNSITNPIDLLAKLPNIQVSADKESVTVIGKGTPLLYIDNQKVEINDLNSLSVDDIKSIEIIENPSSRYEANGRVVINITRKFSKKEGLKVDISEKLSFQRYFNNYFGIHSSFKKKKLEFKANFNYNQLTVWESNGNDFTIPINDIVSNYRTKAITRRPQFILGAGIFYKINEDDYLSFNCNERFQNDRFDITTNTYNQEQNTIGNIYTLNANKQKRNFLNTFLNYNHKIRSLDAMLFSGFQYSRFKQPTNGIISNDFNDTGIELTQKRDQEFLVNVFSGKIDVEKEFKNKMTLEVGTLFLEADAITKLEIENFNTEANSFTDYQYNEKNIAAYSQISGNFKKIKYSIGVRGENTIVKGKYASADHESIDKNYINLFPKASFHFSIDDFNSMSLTYAKSINRPIFSRTSQVSTYINPYFVWANNIDLDPTLLDEVSLSYQFKNKILQLSYTKMKSPVHYATSYDESQSLVTMQSENFDQETAFSLEFTLPFEYKNWSTTNVINGILNKVENKQSVVNQSKPYLYYYSNHLFKFKKGIKMMVTGWGMTNRQEGVYKKNGLFIMNFSLSKTFLNRLDCTLSYNDIFRQMKFTENFTTNDVQAKGIYYTDANLVLLSVKYSFGKIKDSEFKERNIDDNLGRIR
ncbi:TonB-dependent receptor [Flavobacterium sediminis]|uniref:TonB-dependent receptor n=1 Tax=Flavobacterium sediminis TaxID=2201181 RepID=A0A2U8QZ31_9FLAO|nr:outer membrane beta-barrel protein [Flavobacterium sediminis]AWM15075.1 TonB-dependent receptor [Flavobacterium sediminis]